MSLIGFRAGLAARLASWNRAVTLSFSHWQSYWSFLSVVWHAVADDEAGLMCSSIHIGLIGRGGWLLMALITRKLRISTEGIIFELELIADEPFAG